MSTTLIALIALSLIIFTLLYLGRQSNLKRRKKSRELLSEFTSHNLRTTPVSEQASLSHQIKILNQADEAVSITEENVKSSFPKAPLHISGDTSRETTIKEIQSFFGSESFRVAVGAGEMGLYSIWSNLDGSPFVETIHTVSQSAAEIIADQGTESLESVVPTVKLLLLNLGQIYQDHPEQVIDLLTSVAGILYKADALSLIGLMNHVFSPERLELYAGSLETIAEPLIDGFSQGLEVAIEGFGALEFETAFVGGDAPLGADFHFPVVTLVLSTAREIQLLDQGKTTLDAAFGNAVLDVTGTGVGGWIGGKAGATAGTAVFPGFGTVIGGLFGAIIGAFGGRFITNEIKYIDARAAQAEYETTYQAMEKATKQEAHKAYAGLLEVQGILQREFNSSIGHAPRLDSNSTRLAEMASSILGAVREELTERRRELTSAHSRMLTTAPTDAWYDFLVGGRIFPGFKSTLDSTYRNKLMVIDRIERQMPKEEYFSKNILSSLQQLATLPITPGKSCSN